MSDEYILAMYDVRSKQDFIYKSTKCKEIIGASHIIEDVFKEYLYPAARSYRSESNENADIYSESDAIYQYPTDEKFSVEKFKQRIKDGYLGEVVYEGGGNFFVLYKDKDTCIGINRIFSRDLLVNVDTLRVLCTWISNLNFNDYKEDHKRIYARHNIDEAHESETWSINTLPFIQVAPDSGRPYTGGIIKIKGGQPEKVTTEQGAKYKKYFKYIEKGGNKDAYDEEAYLLDELVTSRGSESLLAVIHIDVNGMGAAVQKCLDGKETYEECIDELRKFSNEIQENLVEARTKAINTALEKKYPDRKRIRRTIIAAGDDLTIICNAHDVLDIIKAYFTDFPEDKSACAGIAIFHSHSPYSEAYRIAEECCENAKRMVKNPGNEKLNLMDFYYCQGGADITLERIREKESGGDMFSKPWQIEVVNENDQTSLKLTPLFGSTGKNDEKKTEEEKIDEEKKIDEEEKTDEKKQAYYQNGVMKMAEILNKIGRSNVKALARATEKGVLETKMEEERILAHSDKKDPIKFDLKEEISFDDKGELDRKLIFDITTVYDLWFREG